MKILVRSDHLEILVLKSYELPSETQMELQYDAYLKYVYHLMMMLTLPGLCRYNIHRSIVHTV